MDTPRASAARGSHGPCRSDLVKQGQLSIQLRNARWQNALCALECATPRLFRRGAVHPQESERDARAAGAGRAGREGGREARTLLRNPASCERTGPRDTDAINKFRPTSEVSPFVLGAERYVSAAVGFRLDPAEAFSEALARKRIRDDTSLN